jgi:hypothetical protein
MTIPAEWMPSCRMDRIVIHWTASAAEPTDHDMAFYHMLVGQSGKAYRGNHSIRDNAHPITGPYAAHCLGTNTGSIGLAVCGMMDARETPFAPGPCPITEAQCLTACNVAAQICRRYGIPVTPKTVLNHGEVEANLGRPQRSKWDALVLPWALHLSRREAGDWWRDNVSRFLREIDQPAADEPSQPIRADVAGTNLAGYLEDGAAWVQARKAIEALGYAVLAYALPSGTKPGTVVLGRYGTKPETGVSLTADLNGGTLYCKARSLATALNKQVSWDPSSRKVSIF